MVQETIPTVTISELKKYMTLREMELLPSDKNKIKHSNQNTALTRLCLSEWVMRLKTNEYVNKSLSTVYSILRKQVVSIPHTLF